MAREGKEVVFVEVVPGIKHQLRTAANILSDVKSTTVDMSDIVREAINEKLESLAEQYPQIKAAA